MAQLRPGMVLGKTLHSERGDTLDRPYRPAMALDKVGQIMQEMAGPHLNKDVVMMLMRTIPSFPVGHWVEVTSGRYRGWRGVVTAISADALHLPTIRLMLDECGDRATPAVELDLRGHEVGIRGLPPGDAPWELDLPTPVAV